MLDLFSSPEYECNKPIRLITTFSGVGTQEMAMRDIGADFEIWKAVEFDDFAIKSYNAIHHTNFPPLDITKIHAKDLEIVDRDKYEYLLTYSYPCTDCSSAGKQMGMEKGSGTRSALLWEIERILTECGKDLPHVLVMENVTEVHNNKNYPAFAQWLNFLMSLGYSNYYQDLNAKDFGIPQNRDRCFMVSILGDYTFDFPETISSDFVTKDILDEVVDEKYFNNSDKAKDFIKKCIAEGKVPELKDE